MKNSHEKYLNLNNSQLIRHLNSLQMEITTVCNLKCIMCPQVNSEIFKSRPKKFMDKDLFSSIVEDIAGSGIHFNAIFPFWLGESLMHRDFPFFYEKLMSLNFANSFFNCLEFDTNAHFLGEEMSRHLLDFQKFQTLRDDSFLRIYFSIDSVNKNTYEKIRTGGDLDTVINNVLRFLELRNSRKQIYPKIALQMVIQDDNNNEIDEFCDFFKKEFKERGTELDCLYALNKDSFSNLDNYHDVIFLRPLYTAEENQKTSDENYIEAINNSRTDLSRITSESEDDKYFGVSNRTKNKIDGICSYLMTRPLITVDGDVLPCFNDEGLINRLGNLKENSFLDVWNGRLASHLRKLHCDGKGSHQCIENCNAWIKFEEPEKKRDKKGYFLYPEI